MAGFSIDLEKLPTQLQQCLTDAAHRVSVLSEGRLGLGQLTQVRSQTQTWPDTSGMRDGGIAGQAFTTSQITAIHPGAHMPVFVYEDGEYAYSLDAPRRNPTVGQIWFDGGLFPSLTEATRLGLLLPE